MNHNVFLVEFFRTYRCQVGMQPEYLIFYLVEGQADIWETNKHYHLQKDEFLIINSNRRYSVALEENALFLKIAIDYRMLNEMSEQRNLLFRCYSSQNKGIKYEKFRYFIGELIGEYAMEPQGLNCRKMSCLYNICDFMVRMFRVSELAVIEQNDRTEKMLRYIEEHYCERISLEDIAEHVHMAPASFSRSFHKTIGITFVAYLTRVRLEHAANALLDSEYSISEIAMEHGFGSIPQFNKQFLSHFKMTPSEYRNAIQKMESMDGKELGENLMERLTDFLNKTRLTVIREDKVKIQAVEADVRAGERMHNPCTSILNMGVADRLLSAEYQRQIIFLKQTLNFEYGCMECLFSNQFHLKDEFGKLNYVKLDSILDLMIEHGIRPFLILDSQMNNVLKNMDDTKTIDVIKVFDSLEECIAIIGQVMDHLLYRYGQSELSEWKFAVWYDTFNDNILGLKNDFVEVWNAIYGMIIHKIPNAQIGGCGLGPTVEREKLKEFYKKWRVAAYVPAFLTLHCLPYGEAGQGNYSKPVVRRNVEIFFEEDITIFKSILKEIEFPELPIIVSEWNLSFLQRNYFNDMAGKAAIMLHHMIFAINEVAEICYWPASDIYAEDFDADSVLNGAAGLISPDGICKPTFYALAFMQELYGILVARGNHYIVTKNDHGHYCIILYNNKKLNYTYYNQEETQIKPTDGVSIFSDKDALEITITLKEVENRKYMLRKQLVGEEVGSILDEWLKFGVNMPLRMNDIHYLKSRCIPLRINEELSVQDGNLVLQEKLRAHEIMLLQLI